MSVASTSPNSQALTPNQVETAIAGLSASDWKRALAIARILSGGVAGWTADDLLQEAITKLLAGDRVWPDGVRPMVVLKNVMHSIASNARKQDETGPIDKYVEVDAFEVDDEKLSIIAPGTTGITPEDVVSGKEQIAVVYAALAGDEDLQMLAIAWGEGLRGEAACEQLGWDAKKYDAERKRLTRRLQKLDPDRSLK